MSPNSNFELYLVRHGQTEWSKSGQHTGLTDLPLIDEGRDQSAALAPRLAHIAFDGVLVSSLRRARETAQLAGVSRHARITERAVELDYGAYEGKTTPDIQKEHPGWDLFRDGSPGGESLDAACERADEVLTLLRDLGRRVLLVSHGHFTRLLTMRYLGLPITRATNFGLAAGSVSMLNIDRNRPNMALWNYIGQV